MRKKLTKGPNGLQIEIDSPIAELLNLNENDEVVVKTDGKSLIIKKENTKSDNNFKEKSMESTTNEKVVSLTTPPPLPTEVLPDYVVNEPVSIVETITSDIPESAKIYLKELDYYWDKAVEDQMCEKFMGTIRPYLRAKLGYSFSEIKCEQEAKKICFKYYKTIERGEEPEIALLISEILKSS